MPLTHTLGLICGILGIIILMGSLVLIYLHCKRKRNTPIKHRVLQLRYPENENVFLENDTQLYSTSTIKGNLIPFNISPYKYYTTQKHHSDLASHHQNLLTPNHNFANFSSQNVIMKPTQVDNARGIDSCIYTSLPASETDSFGTTDHNPKKCIPINSKTITKFSFNNVLEKSINQSYGAFRKSVS